jgi:hypothetical protein
VGTAQDAHGAAAHENRAPSGFVFGTNAAYAKYHQDGTAGHAAHGRRQTFAAGGGFTKARSRKRAAIGTRILEFKAGGGKIPQRLMMPTQARGIPPKWFAAFERTFQRESRKLFKK